MYSQLAVVDVVPGIHAPQRCSRCSQRTGQIGLAGRNRGGGLLSPELQKTRLESTRPVNPTDPQSPGYGLALARFGPMYGHTGELPGYNTFTGYDPDRKITVVVWSSLAPSPDGRDAAAQTARTVIGELYGMGG